MTVTTDLTARISGLTISYAAGTGRVRVVDDLSLDLRAGRTLGLVGESGSGKSTVADTLLGHLRPGSAIDSGTVEVQGQDVFALAPRDLRELRGRTVALVPQNAGHSLTPSMRIGEQIREALAVHGLPAGDDRVHELLARVRLPSPAQLARRYPHELSGGQQQRVTIAMAIAPGPKVLVLDEPTTALDVITQAAVLALVADLRDELGMAVLIVSHDLGVVSAVSDEVVVMRTGADVEHGPTSQVLTAPRADYTRELLAAAPRIEGTEPPPLLDLGADVVLACEGVDIRYPHAPRRAVTDFGVQVRHSETVALVGESGSGKSTVATALAGLVRIEAGRMTLRDADGASHDLGGPVARRPRAVRRGVQMVFQNADLALNPRRSVADAIARPLTVFGILSRNQRRAEVEQLLIEVGLGPEFAPRLPGQLSGGQRQRVGIARALAARPSLLIADEPTTALDVSVQAEVLDLLDELRERRGLACLFISHDLAVVRRLAHRIVVMNSGHIVESAPTSELFADPRHPYTRTLLDSVVEPGQSRLPDADLERRRFRIDGAAELATVGTDHLVRLDQGVHA
ncbi:dipeptide ABC transporter ATP-binding protein [Pseudactinotalea sp. HY160]|uniref:dipeptide ABC transporter ATP-binding protein n=1 Tax=Pseudactinotalea sp. HY160 TaxID=2654490 RepID=UPI00128CFD18|nr:ABC transporter ATP-binding protein [Pseudactinotalea sp. HY160]MPV51314.1 dipeptide ABC transporter ATP-binding protein [Pseudactinotalea sp. HY160]